MNRGHALYERSKGKASVASYQRAKEMIKDPKWSFAGIHPVLLRGAGNQQSRSTEAMRMTLLRSVNSFRPSETILEIGTKGSTSNTALMKERRKVLAKSIQRKLVSTTTTVQNDTRPSSGNIDDEITGADEIMVSGPSFTKMANELTTRIRQWTRLPKDGIFVMPNSTCLITRKTQQRKKGKLEINYSCLLGS